MISMIVCSVDPAKLEKFCENVLMKKAGGDTLQIAGVSGYYTGCIS